MFYDKSVKRILLLGIFFLIFLTQLPKNVYANDVYANPSDPCTFEIYKNDDPNPTKDATSDDSIKIIVKNTIDQGGYILKEWNSKSNHEIRFPLTDPQLPLNPNTAYPANNKQVTFELGKLNPGEWRFQSQGLDMLGLLPRNQRSGGKPFANKNWSHPDDSCGSIVSTDPQLTVTGPDPTENWSIRIMNGTFECYNTDTTSCIGIERVNLCVGGPQTYGSYGSEEDCKKALPYPPNPDCQILSDKEIQEDIPICVGEKISYFKRCQLGGETGFACQDPEKQVFCINMNQTDYNDPTKIKERAENVLCEVPPRLPPPCSKWINAVTKAQIDPKSAEFTNPDIQKVCAVINSAVGPIETDPMKFIAKIFTIILSLSGGIALILIIVSGYQLMASQGNPEKLQGAKDTLTSAIIGLIFIIFSLVILETIGVDLLGIPGLSR